MSRLIVAQMIPYSITVHFIFFIDMNAFKYIAWRTLLGNCLGLDTLHYDERWVSKNFVAQKSKVAKGAISSWRKASRSGAGNVTNEARMPLRHPTGPS